MFKLCVYGTMRKGGKLNSWLQQPFLESESKPFELKGVRMYNLGGAPGCTEGTPGNSIVAEVLIFNDGDSNRERHFIELLDEVEGVPSGMYRREEVNTPHGKAWMYFYNFDKEPDEEDRVHDWMKDVIEGGHVAKKAKIVIRSVGS